MFTCFSFCFFLTLTGQLISTKKEELVSILDNFNIQVREMQVFFHVTQRCSTANFQPTLFVFVLYTLMFWLNYTFDYAVILAVNLYYYHAY